MEQNDKCENFMENEKKLKQAFQAGLGVPAGTDYESLAYAKSEGWDSVAHMKLIASIEEAFDIMMDTEDVIALSSYPIAREIVKKYEASLA